MKNKMIIFAVILAAQSSFGTTLIDPIHTEESAELNGFHVVLRHTNKQTSIVRYDDATPYWDREFGIVFDYKTGYTDHGDFLIGTVAGFPVGLIFPETAAFSWMNRECNEKFLAGLAPVDARHTEVLIKEAEDFFRDPKNKCSLSSKGTVL